MALCSEETGKVLEICPLGLIWSGVIVVWYFIAFIVIQMNSTFVSISIYLCEGFTPKQWRGRFGKLGVLVLGINVGIDAC